MDEVRKDFYSEKPIKIRLSGSYHDFGASSVRSRHCPVSSPLHDIDIAPKGRDPGFDELVLNVTAKTYRYLDQGGTRRCCCRRGRGPRETVAVVRVRAAGRGKFMSFDTRIRYVSAVLRCAVARRLRERPAGPDAVHRRGEGETGRRIEPLPQVKPYETFTYDAQSLRSPFRPDTPRAGLPRPGRGRTARPKEYLEQFPLDTRCGCRAR